MEVKIRGRVRQLLQAFDQGSPGDDEQLSLTEQYSLLVSMDSSLMGEVTRVGRAFKAGTTAAVAAVTAIPTTAVMYAIYNNEPDGGRSYIVDRIWAQNVVSGAVVAQAQLLALVGQVRETAPTDATPANTLLKLNGFGSQGSNKIDSKVISILAGTALPAATGLAGFWMPQGMNATKPSAVATPGYGMEALIQGRIIVPPGRYFAMHVLANVVGETFVCGVEWHEKTFKLG